MDQIRFEPRSDPLARDGLDESAPSSPSARDSASSNPSRAAWTLRSTHLPRLLHLERALVTHAQRSIERRGVGRSGAWLRYSEKDAFQVAYGLGVLPEPDGLHTDRTGPLDIRRHIVKEHAALGNDAQADTGDPIYPRVRL